MSQNQKLELTSVLCDFDQTTPFEVVSIFDEEMWMVGNKFGKCLEYSCPNKAIRDFVSNSNKRAFNSFLKSNCCSWTYPSRGKTIQKNTMFINKAGLFELIDKSRMPKAIEFKSWINNNLLPKLCDTGKYSMVTDAPMEQAAQMNAIHQLTKVKSEEPASWYLEKLEFCERLMKAHEIIFQQREELSRQALQFKDDLLHHKDEVITAQRQMLEMKSRVAPMTESDDKKHVLRIMAKPATTTAATPTEYAFCRTQRCSIEKSTKKAVQNGFVKKAFELVDAPNSMNVLNCLKEHMKANKISYSCRKNRLSCDTDIIAMVSDLVEKT